MNIISICALYMYIYTFVAMFQKQEDPSMLRVYFRSSSNFLCSASNVSRQIKEERNGDETQPGV